jgi:hypothetical protein
LRWDGRSVYCELRGKGGLGIFNFFSEDFLIYWHGKWVGLIISKSISSGAWYVILHSTIG